MNIVVPIGDLTPWLTGLGAGLVAFSVAPNVVLRLIALSFPKADARRREIIAELHSVPRWERPFWVTDQFERVFWEAIPARLEERAKKRAASRAVESVPGAIHLTPNQRRLLIALSEPALRRGQSPFRRRSRLGLFAPSAAAANRLGWTLSAFNRKLDNMCDRLDRAGVEGMKSSRGNLAVQRRARLVDYAISNGLVTRKDLALLDEPPVAR